MTDRLNPPFFLDTGGTFLTKVYRSSDYNALMWVFNQLFHSVQVRARTVDRRMGRRIYIWTHVYDPIISPPTLKHHQAIKPSSSRQQSAEIFVLCLKYRAPHAIDPRLLDPAYVFQEVCFQ